MIDSDQRERDEALTALDAARVTALRIAIQLERNANEPDRVVALAHELHDKIVPPEMKGCPVCELRHILDAPLCDAHQTEFDTWCREKHGG